MSSLKPCHEPDPQGSNTSTSPTPTEALSCPQKVLKRVAVLLFLMDTFKKVNKH